MGISVSASTAIIVAGMFVAFATLYPVASNGFERVSDASIDVHDRGLEQANTVVTVANATYDDGENELTVVAVNDGTTELSITDTSLVVGNDHVALDEGNTAVGTYDESTDSFDDSGVDTAVWLPGEAMQITVERDQAPDRVTVVAENGVSAGATVEEGA